MIMYKIYPKCFKRPSLRMAMDSFSNAFKGNVWPANRVPVLTLFSGGRDSSLVACLLARDGRLVHLLTCDNGVSIGADLSAYRYNELRTALGDRIVGRAVVSTMGLFRRIALADIENDFARFHKNLIVLGSQLAMHTEAVVYCLNHGIQEVASGFTTYQCSFAEQMPDAIKAIGEFMSQHSIKYLTPVADYDCPDKVKFRLLDFGVSTKSLESVSVFADTFTEPSSEQVLSYIAAKLPICNEYIAFKCSRLSKEDAE